MHYTFLIKQAAQCGSRVTLPRSINYESNGDKWTDAETGKPLTPAQVLVAKRDALEYKQRLRGIGAYKKADVLDNRASTTTTRVPNLVTSSATSSATHGE